MGEEMAVEIQKQSVNTNGSFELEFSDNIMQYALGIAYFDFHFTGKDHHLRALSLSLSPTQVGNKISGTIWATMNDAHTAALDDSSSWVHVVAIAVVGEANSSLAMGAVTAIPAGGQSGEIPLADSDCNLVVAGMSGFSLGYGSGVDHHIYSLNLGIGTSQSGYDGYLTGQASMVDDEGNAQDYGNVSGVLISQASGTSALGVITTANLQELTTSDDPFYPIDEPISGAVAMLTNMQVQFEGKHDHHVARIRGGCSSCYVPEWADQSIFLVSPGAIIKDKDGNHVQDDSESWVQMNLFYVPEAAGT